MADMKESIRCNFRRGVAPFAFFPRLALAPHFKWTMITCDYMHAVDLGILLYQIGQVWWTILPHLAPESRNKRSTARQKGLQALKARLRLYYKARRTKSQLPLRRVTLNWLRTKHGIKLRAHASQANALVGFTADLAEEFKQHDGHLGNHRCCSMQSIASIARLSRQDVLTEGDVTAWRRLSVEHMFHYACCQWPVYPKFRLFQHMPHFILRCGVPRTYWVYSDEAKNKQVKNLWTMVSKGHASFEQVFLRLLWHDDLSHV